jgi:hypothetical protein
MAAIHPIVVVCYLLFLNFENTNIRNKILYQYFSNGFYLDTEIEFPEFVSAIPSGFNKVKISLGEVPEIKTKIAFNDLSYQVSKNEFVLDIKGVARYLLKDTTEIIIHPYPNADPCAIRLFVFSIIFSVLIYKHDMMAIHSCSVMHEGKAIIFSGDSGAGKSTIALGFHNKQFEVLNDDISTVFFDTNGLPLVHVGNTRLRLWPQSLHDFGFNIDEFKRVRPEIEKFSFPLLRSRNPDPVALKAVFLISVGDGENIEKRKLNGIELFENLKRSTFSQKLVEELGKTATNFKLYGRLANKVPAFKITRPRHIHPSDFVDYLVDQLSQI